MLMIIIVLFVMRCLQLLLGAAAGGSEVARPTERDGCCGVAGRGEDGGVASAEDGGGGRELLRCHRLRQS